MRPGGLRDFKKIKPLGQGSFGHVLLCEHKDTKEKRAVKVLKKRAFVDEIHKNLLMNELAIACKINHPNIVPVHDLLEDERHYYIVMEYAPLGDLKNHLIAEGPNFNA